MAKKEKRKVDDDWRVAGDRPEDLHETPGDYWNEERVSSLAKAHGQARIQYKITRTALAHFKQECDVQDFNVKGSNVALDLGFGLGFSSEILLEEGFVVVGIEILEAMVEQAEAREFIRASEEKSRLHLIMASINALPLRGGIADFSISISAVQWIQGCENVDKFCRELSSVMIKGGGVAIQYYPKSKRDAMSLGMKLKEKGFRGGIRIDNAENPRKRKLYIVLKKLHSC